MKTLLVEDDLTQRDLISEALKREFPELELWPIATESEFRDSLDEIGKNPPALIIMDVMLRWCDPSEQMPAVAPDATDFSRAGVRCCHLLKNNPKTKAIPIIVLTVLDKNGLDLPPYCFHVPKTSDLRALIDAVADRVRQRAAV
jgi:CheY-like chemotaxis protein